MPGTSNLRSFGRRDPGPLGTGYEPYEPHKSVTTVETRSTEEYPLNDIPQHKFHGSSSLGDADFKPARPAFRHTLSSWAFEIFAITVSTASIVAIVAVLFREKNRPLTAWKFALSLNTVIATLGTLARSTLAFAMSACIGQQKWSWLRRKSDCLAAFERFDEASRGPWGSTRLVYFLRLRHWAVLGGLVTIGTVAFDPFFQAVVSNYGRLDNVFTDNSTSIGQTLKIDGGETIEYSTMGLARTRTSTGDMEYVGTDNRPDFGIISALYNGFHNTSEFRQDTVGFQCATGNCTWPVFASAAVCSSCADVSSSITVTKGYGKDGSNVKYQTNIAVTGNYTAMKLPYSNITNWNGKTNINDTNWYKYTTGGGGSPTTLMTANVVVDHKKTIKFQGTQTLLMAFAILQVSDDWLEGKILWEDSTPVATECALYLCANAYQATCQNGTLKEEVVGSWAVRDPASYKYDPTARAFKNGDNANTWVAAQDQNLLYQSIDIGRYDLRLLVPADQSTQFPSNLTREVNITATFLRSTIDYLGDFSKGAIKATDLSLFPDTASPILMDALWNSTNLTTTFQNVAKSLTNQIRNNSPQRHPGTLQNWVIHVQVDWAFLAFPVSMLLAGILYVILTIAESVHLRLPIWKEEALPTLLHGLDEETQSLIRATEGNSSDTRAKPIVRLEFDEQVGSLRLLAK